MVIIKAKHVTRKKERKEIKGKERGKIGKGKRDEKKGEMRAGEEMKGKTWKENERKK